MKKLLTTLALCSIGATAYAASLTLPPVTFSGGGGGPGGPPNLTSVFDCSAGFTAASNGGQTGGPCAVNFPGEPAGSVAFHVMGPSGGPGRPVLSGSTVSLINSGQTHNANNLNFATKAVNVRQFSTTFTYVPDGQGLSFILSNNTNTASANRAANGGFAAGAGCEAAFFQGFPGVPNDTFAVMLDQYGGNTAGSGTFTYSNVQYYDTEHTAPNPPNGPGQSPCNPNQGGEGYTYVGVNKISTYPVPLNNPVNAVNTSTGDLYSVTITYDGNNLTIKLYDVTKGGSCPGAKCFSYTWANVNVPAMVGADTAWPGLGAATGIAAPLPQVVNSWSYSN